MALDLKSLTKKELGSLIIQARKQQTALKKRKPVVGVRKKLAALAKAEGYTIAELFGGKTAAKKAAPAKKAAKKTAKKAAKKATRKNAKKTAKKAVKAVKTAKVAKARKPGKKVAPKYRNPANAQELWSGRGKQPRWLAEQVKKGKKVEEFLIKK